MGIRCHGKRNLGVVIELIGRTFSKEAIGIGKDEVGLILARKVLIDEVWRIQVGRIDHRQCLALHNIAVTESYVAGVGHSIVDIACERVEAETVTVVLRWVTRVIFLRTLLLVLLLALLGIVVLSLCPQLVLRIGRE